MKKTEKAHPKKTDKNIIREDGRIEWVCEHGVGHPVGHVTKWVDWMGIHGCCGESCCYEHQRTSPYVNDFISL